MCVIYGWDSKCQASQEWIYQMGVNHLPNRDKQPFYNVFVDDGSNRYAAQGMYCFYLKRSVHQEHFSVKQHVFYAGNICDLCYEAVVSWLVVYHV